MSHFYGTVRGGRGEATRCGFKTSGLVTNAASYKGSIKVYVYYDENTGKDKYEVAMTPWQGSGGWSRTIATGVLDANGSSEMNVEQAFNGIQLVLRGLQRYNDSIHS